MKKLDGRCQIKTTDPFKKAHKNPMFMETKKIQYLSYFQTLFAAVAGMFFNPQAARAAPIQLAHKVPRMPGTARSV